jgi:hypothetical protein
MKMMEVEIQKEKNVEKNKSKKEEKQIRKLIAFLCNLHACIP